jgi:GNAT superfamily N-acetyltransferase
MTTEADRATLVRRIEAADVAKVLYLVEQIESPDDLARSAHLQFKRELEHPDSAEARFVAIAGGRIVGTMGCGPGAIPSRHALWMDWLIVDRNYRRRNIALALYTEIEAFAQRLGKKYLCLDIGNIDRERAAHLFHRHNGFQIIGQIPDYWGKFEHLHIMAKCLISSEDR